MLNNSHSELKSAVGDRLLLWCVTSTTPATCHQVKQLYLAVPAVEKNTHTIPAGLDCLHVLTA